MFLLSSFYFLLLNIYFSLVWVLSDHEKMPIPKQTKQNEEILYATPFFDRLLLLLLLMLNVDGR